MHVLPPSPEPPRTAEDGPLILNAPAAFHCPYQKACWTREAVRILIAAAVACSVSLIGGCWAWRWDGFGVTVQYRSDYPPAYPNATQPAPPANLARP